MSKVLVIGDSCIDKFIYGTCDRLSPEAPVPVFKPIKSRMSGGMTTNVYNNLQALGVSCDIITNDIRPIKTRYIDEISNQMLLRVDEKDSIEQIGLELFKKIDFKKYDIVVISDYNKGFLSEIDIEAIVKESSLVFLDTKKKIGNWAKDVDFIKINENEFINNWSTDFELWFKGNLITTLGKDGAILNDGTIYSIMNKHDFRDVSGAGDTFLAGLVADYIKNNDIRSAIRFANRCASWVVSQKGVIVIKPEKL